jgi:transposase
MPVFSGFAPRWPSQTVVTIYTDVHRFFPRIDLELAEFCRDTLCDAWLDLPDPFRQRGYRTLMYPRTVRIRSSNGTLNEYVRVVEAYRENGKVKQRVVVDLGRKDVLLEVLPKLQRLLRGDIEPDEGTSTELKVIDASTWGPVLAVRILFDQLGLWGILDRCLRRAKGVSFTDRAFVLIANRLIRPTSEHGLAGWLETDFVCDRMGRRFVPNWHRHNRVRVHPTQLEAWYRTLDQLYRAKERIEEALYHHLRDLFSFKPDLVLYDITSTYFEGAGPKDFAKHGYSRDGKPRNVQVVVGVVMVAGWPIAHHVWPGNRVDHETVQEVVGDLQKRFGFGRVVFVGDRGMVTAENLELLKRAHHGFVVGLDRRRNSELKGWLDLLDETKWLHCPVGINAQERKTDPPRTRAQEVASGDPEMRVIIVDSDERRQYEQAMRQRAMDRTRQKLEKLKARVRSGGIKNRDKIIKAAERILGKNHGQRYYAYELNAGGEFEFSECRSLEHEKRIEGKYVIATAEKSLSVLEALAIYKDLADVERGFRHLKDVLAMRPIYHQIEPRVRAHIFVAALALLVQRLLDRRLQDAKIDLSSTRAMEALSTVRHVTFRVEGQGKRSGVAGGSPDARSVLRALKIAELRPPAPPAELAATVM